MGLDVFIGANNGSELHAKRADDYFYQHSLSRTFCNLMCRGNVISGETELSQIGRIAGVDISCITQLDEYPDDANMEIMMEMTMSDEEREDRLAYGEASKAAMEGNIDRVLATINALIAKLGAIHNLPVLLAPTTFDTLDNETYFANFNSDTGDGYIGNNFGQDLRNFRRFLEFAKAHGTSTVWFEYG